MPITKDVLEKSTINQQNVNKKSKRYYIKDGIKCTKRDMRQNIRQLQYQVLDLIVGYWKLLTTRNRKGDQDNG